MNKKEQTSKTTEPSSEKGGARPGAGRKPLPGKFVTTLIISDALKEDFKKLGGSKWVREQIEKAVYFKKNLPPDCQFPSLYYS